MNDDKIPVNDGGGLFDAEGVIDSMIVDANELVKAVATGQYIRFCNLVVGIVQRLALLKNGIKNDMQSLKDQIEELKGGDENV